MRVYELNYLYWRMSLNVEKTYKKVTQIEHILMRPDMYVGSVAVTEEQLWVLSDDHFQLTKIKYIPGLYKIFDEILVNAADNYQRDKKMGMIRVDFGKDQISVMNDGKSIPVQMHKTHKMLVPELIFGYLLTSSNYEDSEKKTIGGRNGFGAKLTNIFSTKFSIEIADSVNKKLLKIVWQNNMTQMSEPQVIDYEGKSYTKVSFTPDYKRFGVAKLSPDMLSLLKRRVYDMSGLIKVSVYLNNKLVQVPNFKSYINLYLDSQSQVIATIQPNRQSRWQVMVCRSQGQFMQISFVNGIYTSKGGTHVNYLLDQITERLLLTIAKKKQAPIKPFQIKAQLKIFVNCLIENPSFDSQIKENLTTHHTQFGSSCEIPDDFVKEILKSGIIEKIQHEQVLKQQSKIGRELKKIKKNRLIIPKLDDANEAGRSNQCCLILTQGDSAKTLALCGIEQLGRDYYGVYPLKGKLVNVKQLSPKLVMENAQLSNLVKILGLSFEEEYKSTKGLRYSSVMIMADQDNDGSHIKGLVINFFETFWPSLCRIKGFLKEFITPIVKCKKGNNSINFYSQVDYRKWEQTADDGWTVKYYKGLGTSTAREAKQYFTALDKHELIFQYKDNEDKEALDLAFNKKNADLRKTWLSNYNPNIALDHCIKEIKISDFIHKQLIHFSISDNIRSIPSVIDGLKPSQRKVLYACFKRNLVQEIKVAQLAGYVAEHSAYHHGQMSLCSTIIGMAQNYVGSNNLNLLQPLGQFGTRYQNGKDAASARYIFTKLNKLTRYLFNQADDHVVDYIIEESQMIEPKYYIPILPLILVNGSEGIGTGWSTTVYPHKVLHVIEMVRKKIDGQMWEISIGWEQFKGAIEKDKKSFIVKGVHEQVDQKVIVTEIPPNKSIRDYKQFLEQKLSSIENQSPQIQDLKQYHHDNSIEFLIKFVQECEPAPEDLEKYLKLSSTYQQNNMHLFTTQGKIRKYQNILEILEDFYQQRIIAYQKRKKYLLSKFEKENGIIKNQIRFIEAVINGEFKFIEKKQDWIQKLKQYNFNTFQEVNRIMSTKTREDEEKTRNKDYNYLLTMPIWSFCHEKIVELSKVKDQLSTIIDYYQNSSVQELWLKDISQFEEAWIQAHPQLQKNTTRKSIPSKVNSKRKRPEVEVSVQEIKVTKNKRAGKQNLMQQQLLIGQEQKDGRKIIKSESLQIVDSSSKLQLICEEKPQNKKSSIDNLLSKYLGTVEKKEQMSLQMRIRARISNGDQTFNASYTAAKQEMNKVKNNSDIYDNLEWLQ